MTATSTPGTSGANRRHIRITARQPRPRSNDAATVFPSRTPASEGLHLVEEALRVGREAEEPRELAHEHDDRDPVEKPDPHGLREQLGEHAEAGEARNDAQHTHQHRQHPGERHRLRRVAASAEEREDRRRDERTERRVRPEHEDPRRTEDRVCEQRGHGRVETGHRREPGELGVRHALGDEQRDQSKTGDHVVARPSALVVADELHAWDGAESAPAHICQRPLPGPQGLGPESPP